MSRYHSSQICGLLRSSRCFQVDLLKGQKKAPLSCRSNFPNLFYKDFKILSQKAAKKSHFVQQVHIWISQWQSSFKLCAASHFWETNKEEMHRFLLMKLIFEPSINHGWDFLGDCQLVNFLRMMDSSPWNYLFGSIPYFIRGCTNTHNPLQIYLMDTT